MAVRTAMEHPIGALPRTPFCHYVAFPLKGKREIWREKQGVIYFMYHFGVFPLWWLAPPPCPRKRGHYKAPLCCELLMKGLLCRALLSHRSAGGRWWRQPPRGACISDTRRAVVWFSPPKAAFILAPPRAPTSPAQRYYITPEGESPQPACKAKPITGRTLAAQGQKARQLAQPSRP